MATGSLPKFTVAFLNKEGEWEHSTWPDSGWARFHVSNDPERAIQGAIREAMELSAAEPETHFAVLGPEGEVIEEFKPAALTAPVPF